MEILVTGGAGFIGSHTVDLLLATGARVRVLDNFSSGTRANLPNTRSLEILTGDVRDRADVKAALKGYNHVIHLAAFVSVAQSIEDPAKSADNNITGFLNVLEEARLAGTSRVVYASSAAVYGAPAALPIHESAHLGPISPYGLEKLINEKYVNLYGELYGIPTLGLRYFNIYGPRQDADSPYSGVISKFCNRFSKKLSPVIYGNGEETRDFVYVGDIAKANLAALQRHNNSVCNVGTGKSVSLLQLVETLGVTYQHTPTVTFEPARSGDIPHSCADTRRLKDMLGLKEFTSLQDGLSGLLRSPIPG